MTMAMPSIGEAPEVRRPASSTTRPFYWSLRRELWENRSIHIAPLVAAGVVLFGFLLANRNLATKMDQWRLLDSASRTAKLELPYHFAAFAILVTGVIVAVAYCLGALHGERRDRSILFWKSLPVSDLTAVLAKAAVPTLVVPAATFVGIVATHMVMLLLNVVVLLANGKSAAPLWNDLPLGQMDITLLYGLAVLSLWNAPIYSWLLLVSAWARRVPFLWAVLPPLALCLIEKIAFDSENLRSVLADRLGGGFSEAFTHGAFQPGHRSMGDQASQIDAVGFLTTPDLWIGLMVAGGFLAGAVWLRRRREAL